MNDGDPAYRCWLFNQFQQAVAHEVVPAIHADTGGPNSVIVAGASIGAFNALALVCRYPDLFRAAVCMSGTYDIERFIGGFTDDLFFSSPMHFLPGLEGPALDALRQRFVVLASGSGKWEDTGESWRAAGRARREGRAQPCRRLGPRLRPRLADVVADAPGVPGTADVNLGTSPGSSPCPSVHDGAHAEACSAAADLVVAAVRRAPGWTTYAGCPPTTAATRSSGSRPVRRERPRSCSTPTTTCSPPTRPSWASSPWELTERDGRLYGRGAADCKGNLVMLLTALRALPRPWPVGVRVVCEGSEEMSTGGLSRLVAASPEIVRGRRDARSPTPATSSSARRP